MKLTLNRNKSINGATIGELFVDDKFICYTLEDRIRPNGVKVYAETAIPAGTYKILLTASPRFKRILPLLVNVPGFDGIRIHPGNKKEDTEGCILPGTSVSDDRSMVLNSRDAFNTLFTMMKNSVSPINITINNPKE